MCQKCGLPHHVAADTSRRDFMAGAAAGIALLGSGAMTSGAAFAQEGGIDSVGYAVDRVDGPLQRYSFKRRNLRSDDVLIDILYAGVCHSDIHTLNGDWGPVPQATVPGHEITGRVAAVGASVSRFKVGDAVGVGCLIDSCGECQYCQAGLEQYCNRVPTYTYGSTDRFGQFTQGGYSNKIVVKDSFVIRIPESMDLAAAAPVLCAGITTFSPMQHWSNISSGKVGLVGMGGLGHMGVKLFHARGADVTVFTTTPGKIEDARKLGATEAVLWSDADAFNRMAGQFDYILSTVPQSYDMDPFVKLLKLDGTLTNVGVLTPFDQGFDSGTLSKGRKAITGSHIGGIAETQQVIDYCAERGIAADIEMIPIDKANEAWTRVVNKDVRYRFVIDMSSLHV